MKWDNPEDPNLTPGPDSALAGTSGGSFFLVTAHEHSPICSSRKGNPAQGAEWGNSCPINSAVSIEINVFISTHAKI